MGQLGGLMLNVLGEGDDNFQSRSPPPSPSPSAPLLRGPAAAVETLGGRECIAVSFADITDLPVCQHSERT